MPSALDRIIDGASDPSVGIADLLRRTIAAAHRLRAQSVREWAQRELSGYEGVGEGELPVYRQPQPTTVRAHWAGYMGTSATTTLTPPDMPEEWFSPWFKVAFRQSVSELESYVGTEGELTLPWPGAVVGRWNALAEKERAIHISGMSLFAADMRIPKQALVGVLDAVRTEVLNLAIDLQTADDAAGEAGGPTIEDPKVGEVVTQFVTNMYGGTATIAQGSHIEQSVTVVAGDVGTLTQAAKSIGLEGEALTEYIEAVLAAKDDPKTSKLRTFLDKVRSGAVNVAGGVASEIATDQLMEWAIIFLGG
jgi:hypothetical protein